MSSVLLKGTSLKVEEKKSVFIASSFPLATFDDYKKKKEEIIAANMKARHVLSVAVLGDGREIADENKEPIDSMHRALPLLVKKGYKGFGVYIVRYFGGVLLGAGPLDRLYFKLVFDVLEQSEFGREVNYKEFKVSLSNGYYHPFLKELEEKEGILVFKEFLGPEVHLTYKIEEGKDITDLPFLNKNEIKK